VAGALVFALAAAGVLVWTNFLELPLSLTSQSAEAKLVAKMNDAVAGGGFAATFARTDASKWQLGDGHRLEVFSVKGGDGAFGRLTSAKPLDAASYDWLAQGLALQLPTDFSNRFSGQRIEIGVIARPPSANGTDALSVVFTTNQAGNSGWQKIPICGDFAVRSFYFHVPKLEAGAYTARAMVVISSDASGSGKAAELLGVFVRPAPEPPPS